MTHTKQFIEDVIEGGFTETESWSFSKNIEDNGFEMMADHSFSNIFMEMVLQPSAWEACGKVRGWEDSEPVKGQCLCSSCTEALRSHKAMMILFMTYLADNKSIEEALEAISK